MQNSIPSGIKSLIRRPIVEAATGKSRSTIYRDISRGVFPRPVSIGGCSVAWIAEEVAAVNDARIARKTEQEIEKLVAELEAARTTQGKGAA